MFDGLTLDELNTLVVNKRSEDYESYFSAMDITDKQKERRIKLAQDLEDVFAFTLILLFTMQQYNAIDWEKARKRLESGYLYAVQKYTPVGEDLSLYITDFSYNTIEATKNHADTPYYYSNDRAVYMAENEANTILNRQEFETAIAEGKNSKRWVDMRDKRERETHLEVGGTVKSITEPFVVGDSLMQFPKDTSLGAEPKEIVGCRCSIEYFKSKNAVESYGKNGIINNTNDITSIIKEIGAIPQKAVVSIPPKRIDLENLSFDDTHINYERAHRVSYEESIKWIRSAKISASVWDGRFERFYSEDGAVYVNLSEGVIRTAFSKEEFDEETNLMMEVLKNNGY